MPPKMMKVKKRLKSKKEWSAALGESHREALSEYQVKCDAVCSLSLREVKLIGGHRRCKGSPESDFISTVLTFVCQATGLIKGKGDQWMNTSTLLSTKTESVVSAVVNLPPSKVPPKMRAVLNIPTPPIALPHTSKVLVFYDWLKSLKVVASLIPEESRTEPKESKKVSITTEHATANGITRCAVDTRPLVSAEEQQRTKLAVEEQETWGTMILILQGEYVTYLQSMRLLQQTWDQPQPQPSVHPVAPNYELEPKPEPKPKPHRPEPELKPILRPEQKHTHVELQPEHEKQAEEHQRLLELQIKRKQIEDEFQEEEELAKERRRRQAELEAEIQKREADLAEKALQLARKEEQLSGQLALVSTKLSPVDEQYFSLTEEVLRDKSEAQEYESQQMVAEVISARRRREERWALEEHLYSQQPETHLNAQPKYREVSRETARDFSPSPVPIAPYMEERTMATHAAAYSPPAHEMPPDSEATSCFGEEDILLQALCTLAWQQDRCIAECCTLLRISKPPVPYILQQALQVAETFDDDVSEIPNSKLSHAPTPAPDGSLLVPRLQGCSTSSIIVSKPQSRWRPSVEEESELKQAIRAQHSQLIDYSRRCEESRLIASPDTIINSVLENGALSDTHKKMVQDTQDGRKVEEEKEDDESEHLMRFWTLALIFMVAVAVRLFSVLRYEAIIHEFDPWFNYRTTAKLVDDGIYEFYSWFDVDVWYPLGRIVGGTIYPGLMVTSMILSKLLHLVNFTVSTRVVCVFLAPLFAGNTTLITYWFAKEVWNKRAGLLAAFFIAIVPSYISRSVAGSYDNEGVAIFALVSVFATFVKAVKTGSMAWVFTSVLTYYYMVNAWGGYIFIINLLPLYVIVMVLTGRYSLRLHVAYSSFYALATLMCMQIHFVGFQAVQTGEHMAAAGVFFALQLYGFSEFLRGHLSSEMFTQLITILAALAGSVGLGAVTVGVATGYIAPWTGRFWTLLDPTYAKIHIPIIASVSEHQPTTWSTYFFDLHVLAYLIPVGVYFCMKRLTDATLFIIVYVMSTVYFSGVMVRLMLVLAPAACITGSIAASEILDSFLEACIYPKKEATKQKKQKKQDGEETYEMIGTGFRWAFLVGLIWTILTYVMHSTWAASEAYSSPSIILQMRGHNGERIIFDDFREAYQWLRTNTDRDAKIMSWWDYGYQITGMSNRTVLVDNNTWNNTHIATVGKAMASREDVSYQIMKKMDVEFALVIFGGMAGYSSDDINKFLWMVRIGGTLDNDINEADYLSQNGEYTMAAGGGQAMLNSLMYKMCYYRFGEDKISPQAPTGYDRVRNYEIGNKDIKLTHIEEAFTTEHWIIRIYRVKKEQNRKPTPPPETPLIPSFATVPKQ